MSSIIDWFENISGLGFQSSSTESFDTIGLELRIQFAIKIAFTGNIKAYDIRDVIQLMIVLTLQRLALRNLVDLHSCGLNSKETEQYT